MSPWWDDISDSAKDLVSHLLCVDTSQRYTIDEFLAHPWMKEGPKTKTAPTPAAVAAAAAKAKVAPQAPLDSPLLASMRANNREGRSPGIGILKEAFDITYAVHRMEEESAHRRAMGAGQRGFLGGLNEEDEDEEQEQLEEAKRRHGEAVARQIDEHRARAAANKAAGIADPVVTNYVGRGGANRREAEAALYDGRAGQRDRGRGGSRQTPFELNLGGATLLGRRGQKPVAGIKHSITAVPTAV